MNKLLEKEIHQDYSRIMIESIKEIAAEVFVISFKRTFDFIPGQVIGITDNSDVPARMYSIASGNSEPLIQILFDIKPGGYLTPRLAGLRKGDHILITRPYGSFNCDVSPAFWIAAGTGIAPFLSMFLSGNTQNKTLIHGSRYLDSFYFSDQFESAFGTRYVRCCSGENSNQFFEGRVTRYLENQKNLPTDIKYYICGRAEMVVDTRDVLISKGISYEKILAEIYF